MEKVCEELDEVKAENENLRAANKSKIELIEILKRAQNEQLTRIKEANSIMGQKDQELDEIRTEISTTRRINEDLEQDLREKSSMIKHLSSANDKLRADGEEQIQKHVEENGRLLFALEEANERKIDLEQEINVCRAEIEGLKAHLSASQTKLMEAEKNLRGLKELREGDDTLMRFEEEKIHLEQSLKWKKEQFGHLEEAHEKITNQFKTSQKEWEQERTMLLDEISCQQTKLESQTRILEDVKAKLQMCNNALAHEETRRKNLEDQVSEFKIRFEEVSSECEDTKLKRTDSGTARDDEVAGLRHSLSSKEIYLKEIEYQKQNLEQENIELLAQVKELQSATIYESGNPSLAKLKSKLRSVEQNHKNCSDRFRAKEAEWCSQMEEMTEELNGNRLQLETKKAEVKKIEVELECYRSSAIEMKLRNEIISAVLRSTIHEERLKFVKIKDELIMLQNESSESRVPLEEQVSQTKNNNERIEELEEMLEIANLSLADQYERNESLMRKIESFDQVGQESEKLAEVSLALEVVNYELDEKTYEASELGFESSVWKSIAERYRSDLDETRNLSKGLEASLLAQTEFTETVKQERDELVGMMEEKHLNCGDLRNEVEVLEQELLMREFEAAVLEHITAEKRFEIEKQNLADEIQRKVKNSPYESKEQTDKLQQKMRITSDDLVRSNSSSEKENLLRFADELEDFISKLIEEDMKLMGDMGKMMKSGEETFDSSKENSDMAASFQAISKQQDIVSDGRSPFRQLN